MSSISFLIRLSTYMARGRERIRRVLLQSGGPAGLGNAALLSALPRLGDLLVDFGKLALPEDVTHALADAFRNHYGARVAHSAQHSWRRLKVFGRFVAETHAVRSLHDLRGEVLTRYVEWLDSNKPRTACLGASRRVAPLTAP